MIIEIWYCIHHDVDQRYVSGTVFAISFVGNIEYNCELKYINNNEQAIYGQYHTVGTYNSVFITETVNGTSGKSENRIYILYGIVFLMMRIVLILGRVLCMNIHIMVIYRSMLKEIALAIMLIYTMETTTTILDRSSTTDVKGTYYARYRIYICFMVLSSSPLDDQWNIHVRWLAKLSRLVVRRIWACTL